jgi:4-coumarate--CoA ligase
MFVRRFGVSGCSMRSLVHGPRQVQRHLSEDIVKSKFFAPLLASDLPKMNAGRFFLDQMGIHSPNDVAITDGAVDTKNQHTFRSAYHATYQLAEALRTKLGVKDDTFVAVMSPNHYNYFTAVFATSLVGGISTLVNPLYTEEEIRFQVSMTSAKVIIAHPMCIEKAAKIAKELNIKVISMADTDAQHTTLQQLIDSVKYKDVDTNSFSGNGKEKFDSNRTFIVPFSSGTTGKPKGVMISHRNFICNMLQVDALDGRSLSKPHPSLPQVSCMIPLPLFHIYGTLMAAMGFYTGSKTVYMSAFDLVQFLELVQRHKIQRAHLVPPIILGLAKHPIVAKYDLSSLRVINSAAAPLGGEIQALCKERLGNCIVKQGWGMTELSPAGTIIPDHLGHRADLITGSAGMLVPATEGKIVEPTTRADLKHNQEGEICIRGPQVMKGYFNNVEATKDMIDEGGWLHTGDVGYFNDEGFMFITDRCKELIKYKGYQVPPAELEALICTMEGIADCVVIPVEDEEAGELPRAYVVRQNCDRGKALTAEEVEAFVTAKVAPHKRLRGGVRFTDVIPKSPSGKILRRVQRDMDRAANAANK